MTAGRLPLKLHPSARACDHFAAPRRNAPWSQQWSKQRRQCHGDARERAVYGLRTAL